jgi:voltage-gated potassium channel
MGSEKTKSGRDTDWRNTLYRIIFHTDTFWGRTFDIFILIIIILSIVAVMLESVAEISAEYGTELRIIEWIFTVLFTIEYVLRIWTSPKPVKYIFSFLGIIDFLAITPAFLGIFFGGTQALIIFRSIRLIRVFRIFKLVRYLSGGRVILRAILDSIPKITVFLVGVISLTFVLGTLMYLVEGNQQGGFTSIPKSIYWAIVTLTTVGYGDITPQTPVGQLLASVVMILGYAIIAVPTGIVSSQFVELSGRKIKAGDIVCDVCGENDHDIKANYCKNCGNPLASE